MQANREEIPMKRITAILFFAATVAGACGAAGTAPVGNTRATISRPVSLPDLNDPAVRQRFACSFAPGSFGFAPPAAPAADPSCEADNATNR
jgi:hypothetical protein